jgi:urea transport system substrate-binding protein
VEAVVEDGQSDPAVFALKSDRLITRDKVAAVFGCWTSASRKAVRPVFEKHDHLLLYPVQYEGLEQSPNIFYLGTAPNQQLIPAAVWCCTFLKKKRLFLVGSDYVFPRAARSLAGRDLPVRILQGTTAAPGCRGRMRTQSVPVEVT